MNLTVISEYFNVEYISSILALLTPFFFAILFFPRTYVKYRNKFPSIEIVGRLYVFLWYLASWDKGVKKYKESVPKIHFFKVSIDANKRPKSSGFSDGIYVKPDVSRITPYGADSEHHIMSYRASNNVISDHVGSVESIRSELERYPVDPVLLRGAAGFGKSNLCRYLAYFYTKEDGDKYSSVFLVEAKKVIDFLRRVNTGPYSESLLISSDQYGVFYVLAECINSKLKTKELRRHRVNWKTISKLRNERCLLIIDGLDEVASLEERNEVLELINDPKICGEWTFLIAGRPSSFRDWHNSPLEQAIYFELMPFMETQIERLSINLFKLMSSESEQRDVLIKSRDFIRRITSNTTIELACNPLFLTMMVQLDHSNKRLPGNKPELIGEIINEVVERRASHIDLKGRLLIKEMLIFLAFLSSKNTSSRKIKEEAGKRLSELTGGEEYGPTKSYFDLINFFDNSGLIICDEQLGFSFVNRCYLEYLYASYLESVAEPKEIKDTVKWVVDYEYSDTLFYFTYLHKKPDIILSEIIEIYKKFGGKKYLRSCVDVYCFSKSLRELKLSSEIIDRLKSTIDSVKIENEILFDDISLYISLNLLRYSDPLSKKPLTYRAAKSLMRLGRNYGPDERYIYGVSPTEITALLESINRSYADNRGYFSLPSDRHLCSELPDDAIIFTSGYFRIHRNKSDSFNVIRSRIKDHSEEFIYSFIKRPGQSAGLSEPYSASIPEIINLIFSVWNPSILLTNDEVVFDNQIGYNCLDYCRDSYRKIKEVNFKDPNYRAKLQREHSVQAMIYGRINNKNQSSYDPPRPEAFENLIDKRLGKEDISGMILDHITTVLTTLHSSGAEGQFSRSILCLARLFSMHAIIERSVNSWGRVYIVYTPSLLTHSDQEKCYDSGDSIEELGGWE